MRKTNEIWMFLTVIVSVLILSGSAIFISTQHNQTLREIADTNAKAQKEAANTINNGLDKIGRGICQTSTKQFILC